MKEKNSKIITILFSAIFICFFILNICIKDKEISETERRKLAQFPKITMQNLLNRKAIDDIDKYTVDQFVFRDTFRKIKSFWSANVFFQNDDNGYFVLSDGIYKIEYPLNEKNVKNNIKKIKNIYDKYLKGSDVYYAIIPDKNYYLKNDEHLKIDYNKLKSEVTEELNELKYVDIWDCLDLDDYYKTDLHWKQENLVKVVNEFELKMGLNQSLDSFYEKKSIGEYYGTYYTQIYNNVEPDEMHVLTNEIIENCTTFNYEKNETAEVYYNKKTYDKYDIFVSGPTALIEINNPYRKDDKELIIFRDSFGSSIAPLFIENYKKITLIDLRYISSELLDEYVKFNNQDVIFLYSTLILNQNLLK